VWLAALRGAGCDVELPPDDPRALLGGDFAIRFKHPEVTGTESAVVELLFAYRSIAEDAPPNVLEVLERRVEEAIRANLPSFMFINSLTALAWARGGRLGLLRALERPEVSDHDRDTWKQVRTWSQCIEVCVYGGLNFCSLVAQDLIARAIADATGGTLEAPPSTGRYLEPSAIKEMLASYRAAPGEWNFDPTKGYFAFEPFESWEAIRASERMEEEC
jgi:hypothetical protein